MSPNYYYIYCEEEKTVGQSSNICKDFVQMLVFLMMLSLALSVSAADNFGKGVSNDKSYTSVEMMSSTGGFVTAKTAMECKNALSQCYQGAVNYNGKMQCFKQRDICVQRVASSSMTDVFASAKTARECKEAGDQCYWDARNRDEKTICIKKSEMCSSRMRNLR
ncbi:MAG: hypothetical protein R3215_00065 [Halomonas sp.]|nr:hypothetical protein [Halomonas sp.]